MSTRTTWGGPYPIARALPTVTGRALRRYGFQAGELALRWAEIVGQQVARMAAPERLGRARGKQGAVLELRVLPASAIEIQHLAPLIVERINGYYGRPVVASLRLRQGPLPMPPAPRPAPPPPDPAVEQALAAGVAEVRHERLRAALLSLGRHAATVRSRTEADR
jgi:hypothetical protein